MTPLELLYNHKNLKRALNLDTMVPSAVDKISSLHARVTGEDARQRKERMFDVIDRIAARAREVDAVPLPELKNNNFAAFLKKIDAKYPDE